MPELPEVEASRKFFERHCLGKVVKIAHAQVDAKVFCGHTTDDIQKALQGRKLLSMARKGKYFWTHLDGVGDQVLFHFGMTGNLVVRDHGHPYTEMKEQDWPPRFVKLELTMDDGTQVAFTDARRFAKVKLMENPTAQEPVRSLGPDAFVELPTVAEFVDMLAKQRRPLKALVLDQSFLSGIGNWVADEILYQASIYPETRANALSDTQAALLHTAIRNVLKLAVDAGARSENFPSSWLFHHRWTGKISTKLSTGHTVQFLKVGGRTTAYVPAVQLKTAASSARSTNADDSARDMPVLSKSTKKTVTNTKRVRPNETQANSRGAQKMQVTIASKSAQEAQGNDRIAPTGIEELKSSRPVRKCRTVH